MKEVIKLNNEQEIKIDSCVIWLERYRAQFGRDILPDLMPLLDATIKTVMQTIQSASDNNLKEMADSMLTNGTLDELIITASQFEITTLMHIVWAMSGEEDTPENWARGLDSFPLDEVCPKLFKVLTKSLVTTKNLESLQGMMAKLNLSVLTESSSQEYQED